MAATRDDAPAAKSSEGDAAAARMAAAARTTAVVAAAAAPAAKAVDRAVAFLLRSTQHRPQTGAELTAKLAQRGVDGTVAAAALARAGELGAVDDAAFARAWVADRGHRRGYGRTRLRQELRRRRVPDSLIETALDDLADRDDLTVASDLARRRAAGFPTTLEPRAAARRLQAYLVRRGYGPGLAQAVAVRVSGLDRYSDWD